MAILRRNPWLRDLWWTEVASGIAAVLWAIIALGLHYQLNDFVTLRVVLTIADERFWQVLGVGIGLAQVVAAVLDEPWCRWGVAILALTWWTLLFVSIALAVQTPSLGLYAVFIGTNLMVACRVLALRAPSVG